MNQEFTENQILSRQEGHVGIITLNRPEALNALSLEMIRQIAVTLKRWESDDSIAVVVFAGVGERAFCAGGDIKSFYSSGMDYRRGHVNLNVPAIFFAEEYSLNKQIFKYPKPTVAFMDGIVMGGGYGVAGHCRIRIATEKTVFAMPEVTIGFFPDIGSVYHLLKVPCFFGHYLALTGEYIKAGDMVAAGLADVYMLSDVYPDLIKALAQGDVAQIVSQFSSDDRPDAALFDDYAKDIEVIFQSLDVFQICADLRKLGSPWATATLERLLSRAPLSVSVTAKHLERMAGQSFDTVIAADFQLAQRFIEFPDLYEGIRSVLIDRDNHPVWNPPTLDAVKPEDVDRYFEFTGYSLDDVEIFS